VSQLRATTLTTPLAALCAAMLLIAASAALSARNISYGAVTDAGVQRCDQQRWGSQPAASAPCYRALLTNAAAAVRAEAAWALGDYKSANEWFREALRLQPASALLRVRWGELYVDTHQDNEAYKLFSEALQQEPTNAWAQLGAGQVLLGQFAKQANTHLDAVLTNDAAPAGARLRARLLGAQLTLENGEQDEAAKLLGEAQAIADQSGLNRLELLSLQAAQQQLRGSDPTGTVNEALKLSPSYGEIYNLLGHFHDIRRRYAEAATMYRKALELQPQLWEAHVNLGSALLRENRLSEARAQFEAAFKGDPFNPVSANSLRLLDSVAKFATLVYPEPGAVGAGGAASAPQLVLRINRKESAVLAPYVQQLATEAMTLYERRYNYRLKAPVVIEVYNNHEDFAVRTAGMPGLGLLGVTFGQVLAMDSPSSRALNEFHWGTTLWHELAHVYTLESTDHRVPRWLSEGISVHEEWRTGPIKGVSIPGYVYSALAAGKALPIAELDRGFIRPEYEQQVQVSYMQAGLICEFIDQRWGHDKLVALLAQYADGTATPEAIRNALAVTTGDFDRLFGEYLRQQFGALFAGLRSWSDSRTAALKSAASKDWNGAVAAAQRALKLQPADVEDGSPYVPLAEAQFALGATTEARTTLAAYWQRGGHDPRALLRLANEYHAQSQKAAALSVMQSLIYVAPFDHAQHGLMGDWLLEAARAREALREYQVALALNPPDLVTAHYRTARAWHALKSDKEARSAVLRALEIAPSYQPAQSLLLELVRGQKIN
jgi:tetratricopeptide (TPR) repeat protein